MKNKLTTLAVLFSSAALPTLAIGAETKAVASIPLNEKAKKNPTDFNWSGIFVGISGASAWSSANISGNYNSRKGTVGGFYGGFNLQRGYIIYGSDFDLGYGLSQRLSGDENLDLGINGAARARLGIDTGPALLYGAGGVAFAKGKATAQGNTNKKTYIGWTAGVGAEAKVTSKVFARFEYRHYTFGNQTQPNMSSAPTKLNQGEFRLGLGVKF